MAKDEAMDLIERTLASFSTGEMIVEKELLKYLHIITDGHCGALSSLTYQLYNVCSMLPMGIIVSSVACVIEANSTQLFRDELRRNPHISFKDGLKKMFANPLKLADYLAESPFGRALYTGRDVTMNNVLEMIIQDGDTSKHHCEEIGKASGFDLVSGLKELHRKGVVYSYCTKYDAEERFVFPSSLHSW